MPLHSNGGKLLMPVETEADVYALFEKALELSQTSGFLTRDRYRTDIEDHFYYIGAIYPQHFRPLQHEAVSLPSKQLTFFRFSFSTWLYLLQDAPDSVLNNYCSDSLALTRIALHPFLRRCLLRSEQCAPVGPLASRGVIAASPLKGARGTCSLYPPGTGEQVLLLCLLHKRERRLAHLAWQVWLAGYAVEDRLIRPQLQQAATRISRWMQWFADFKQAFSQHDGEQALDRIERYAEGPLGVQPLRRIRKRIGREHFSSFLSRLLSLSMEVDSERASLADDHEQQLDLRILARGLGLEKRFVGKKEALNSYMVGFFLSLLRWFFRWSQELEWQGLLEHVTAFEMLQARDDLRSWLRRLGYARHYRDRLPKEYPSFEVDFQELFRALSMADQALVLVVWLALQTLPSSWLDEMPAIVIGPDGPFSAN